MERTKNAKKSDGKEEEKRSTEVLDEFVLPLEKIYLAQENRKLFAFCTIGNAKVVSTLFTFLKANPHSEKRHRAFMESFAFADHLLAYHDKSLMDRIRDFLVA